MRRLLSVCFILALSSTSLPAQEAPKHLDPPGPPKVFEWVYLYELTLLQDEDDWINGEAEILIRTKITKQGHESGTWTMLIEDIDMDGDVEEEFTVLDGDLAREERKGGQALLYNHFECWEVNPINLRIDVWEVDSTGAADIFEKLGEAAGELTELGALKGHIWIGKAAEGIGALIDELGNNEDSMGGLDVLVPLGISDPIPPTTRYRFRTLYVQTGGGDFECYGLPREVAWEELSDPTLDEPTREYFELVSLGWDEDHPFTMSPAEAERRLALLQSALDLTDDLDAEADDHPGMEHLPGTMKGGTLALACDSLETEVDEAMMNDTYPDFVDDASDALEQGRSLARDGQYDAALAACFEYMPELLRLNHPTVFYDGFEKTDTRMWTSTVTGVIIVD